jgi:nitrate reductase NapAB chaperone NapD
MPTAYVLVHCRAGTDEMVIREIMRLSDVAEVRGTLGIHDIVVKVRSRDIKTMNDNIAKIRKVPNITSTNTLTAIEEQGGKGEEENGMDVDME